MFDFVKFVASKKEKGTPTNFFTPLFGCCFWIRDNYPGSATLRDSSTKYSCMVDKQIYAIVPKLSRKKCTEALQPY
jgi:hypothetical protein